MVNSVTLYRSPVRLVKHAAEEAEPYSGQAISRARKKMMAEIALAGDEILIDDVPYSRNDAATLLDVVNEDNWKNHITIYQRKGLLNFLEKEEFDNEELHKADAFLYHAAFVQAVSPYFAHSFNSVSGRLLRQQEFEGLAQLMEFQGFILPEHSGEGYQKIRTWLDELNYTLRNLSWEKFIADETVLHFIFSDACKQFLNKLPTSFGSLRDELVEQLTGIVLRFQHKATWHYLHQVLVQVKSIETSASNHAEVVRIDEVIYKNSRIEGSKGNRTSRKGDGEVSSGRIIWWVIWVVLAVVRIATCSNKSSNSNSFDEKSFQRFQKTQHQSKAARVNERRNEALLLNYLASLSKRPSLPYTPLPQPLQTGDQPFSAFADYFTAGGTHTVTVTNTTAHNCVIIYFSGPSVLGSVYAGALSHTYAAYLKKGGSFSFKATPGRGRFHFMFGEEWGRLKKQGELSLSSQSGTGEQLLFVYEFFSNKKPTPQPYLQRGVELEDPSAGELAGGYNYLHRPANTSDYTVQLQLVESGSKFSINASGGLAVKEGSNAQHAAE